MVRVSKDPAERMNEILDVAEQLFIEQGYDNTTVSSIVDEIGVAKGTFYYYFSTKEDIITALLKRRLNKGEEIASKILEDDKLNAVEKMARVMNLLIIPTPDDEQICKYIDPDKNPKLHNKRDELFHEIFFRTIAAIVEEGVQTGLFKAVNYQDITEIIFIGIDGFIHKNIEVFRNKAKIQQKVITIQELLEKVLGIEAGSLDILGK